MQLSYDWILSTHWVLKFYHTYTFKLMTATLFPGVEFLFSITQVIDFKQGRTGYIKETHKFIKSISCSSIQNQRINEMTLKYI